MKVITTQWIVCMVLSIMWLVMHFYADNVAKSDTYLIISNLYIAAGLVVSAVVSSLTD